MRVIFEAFPVRSKKYLYHCHPSILPGSVTTRCYILRCYNLFFGSCNIGIIYLHVIDRSSHQRCSVEKGGACNFIKKETLAQVFSCEFSEISKNTFSQNTSGRQLLNRGMFKKYDCYVTFTMLLCHVPPPPSLTGLQGRGRYLKLAKKVTQGGGGTCKK